MLPVMYTPSNVDAGPEEPPPANPTQLSGQLVLAADTTLKAAPAQSGDVPELTSAAAAARLTLQCPEGPDDPRPLFTQQSNFVYLSDAASGLVLLQPPAEGPTDEQFCRWGEQDMSFEAGEDEGKMSAMWCFIEYSPELGGSRTAEGQQSDFMLCTVQSFWGDDEGTVLLSHRDGRFVLESGPPEMDMSPAELAERGPEALREAFAPFVWRLMTPAAGP